MDRFELMVGELHRLATGLPSSQEATEAFVELLLLKGRPVVASKQHFSDNRPE